IAKNPFRKMKDVTVKANESRLFEVKLDAAYKVLAACPDSQWRLIFALCRFGGLRCPSEVLELTWGDIAWDVGRMTIRSPKTEHHEGKESRSVPIFAELLPYLREAFDLAEPGTIHVVTRYRD